MNFFYKKVMKLRERYIDTLGKLYEYSTAIYENNQLSRMVGSDMGYTYREFRKKCDEISARLSRYGIGAGDRVAILSQNMPNWTVAMFSLVPFGRVSVPILPDSSENEITNILTHSGSKAVFVSKRLLPKLSKECQDRMVLVIDIETFETIKRDDNAFTCDGKVSQPLPDDLATIIYTSGTTADPKGILLTHRNYTANVEQAQSVIGVTPEDRMLIILPLDHCFAHVAGFYTMMSYGASIGTVPAGRTPMEALRNIPMSIKELQPTVMLSVPALAKNFKKNIEAGIKAKGPKVEKLYNFALDLAISYNREGYNKGGFLQLWKKPLMSLFDRLIFRNVRQGLGGKMKFFVGGGALLDIDLQRYYYAIGIPMYQGYGLSEATPIISANAPAKHILGSSGCVVKPMDIKICDEDGRELPYGQKGEIVIRGENVMAGYWKNPKSTAETVVDGWLHTGDMGYMRDKDFLYVVGRFKSLLISADGEKYSPEGIEESLVENSRFIDQVVLHNSQDPYTIALLVPNKEALKSWLKDSAPGVSPDSEEGKKLMLGKIQDEVNSYRKGGKNYGAFPERWLPAAVCVLPEPFTEKNHMVNSTMKIVRGKVEKAYADRMAFAYTPEGKNIVNAQNLAAL